MQIKIASIALFLSLLLPVSVYAYGYAEGSYYGYGYGQSTYYAQSAYYAQPSYQTTFTKNASEAVNFALTGAISKASGTFVIDDPLDPKNKLLYHSFVESPDAKNVYDGIASLDSKGEAILMLPAYFDALNGEVRYQLKPIGAPMPNLYIKTEEKNNSFAIGGGVPGGRVSWQITGIRHDPYILANPIVPEVEKGPGQLVNRGEYLYADGYPSSIFTLALPGAWNPVIVD